MNKKVLVLAMALVVLFEGAMFAGGSKDSGKGSGKTSMVLIPKLKSAWFEPYEADGIAKGKELGIDVYAQSPAAADEAQQVRLVQDSINQGVNALLVVPNDANSLVPAFRDARGRNIVVITHESPNQPEADFDVEMIDNVKFGERFMEELAQRCGGTGEYAVYVGSLTVPAHNIWADAAIALQKRKYPNMTMVDTKFPVSEDRNEARQRTLELLTVHPNLKGILAFGSQGAPGAGQALRERNMANGVTVLGTTSPLEAAPFLKDGSVDACILWSSGDASAVMVYLSDLVLKGRRSEIKAGMEIPGFGKPVVDGINIIFDNPLIVDASNCDNYNF